jgi:hypothetical protein
MRSTALVTVYCCFGIEMKQPKQTVSKQTEKNPKFSEKKYQNMLPIKLFRLLFCLFRSIKNIQFRLFRIETSFEGHPTQDEYLSRSELCFAVSKGWVPKQI